jgi:serine protease AprX
MFRALRRLHHGSRVFTAAVALAAMAIPAALSSTAPAASHDVSYIAIGAPETTTVRALTAELTAAGGRVVAQFPVAGAVVVKLPSGAHAPVGVTLVPDGAMHLAGTAAASSGPADTIRQTVGVPAGVDGRGVTVALLDTGVYDGTDLSGRVDHVNVSGATAGDGYGHGTFMAGLIAGSGAASDGAYTGLAPAAKILDVKVATADGSTSLSRVLAGLQAVQDHHATDRSVRVLNLSLSSGSSLPPQFDPLARALDTLWRSGVTVVVAAGNTGPAAGTVTSPGDDPTVVTVGALDETGTAVRGDDVVADFSSRSPTSTGDAKPDLVAPGAHLVSLRDPESLIDTQYPAARVGDSYFRGSGTSMSAAVASGAVADLLSARPTLSPDQVKRLLTATAYSGAGLTDPMAAGSGGLDLGAALSAPAASAAGVGRVHAGPGGQPGGPSESDAAGWATFAAAWQQGDFAGTARAWAGLSSATQTWAARAWAVMLWSDASLSADPTVLARAWSARAWAGDFAARAWSARAWSGDDWLARAWSARAWSTDDWAARAWSARAWSARAWSANDWAARAWSVSTWANDDWAASSWLGDAWQR